MPRLLLRVLTVVVFAPAVFAAGREVVAPPPALPAPASQLPHVAYADALARRRELAPPAPGPSAYPVQLPHVAFAGGRYLAVWRELLGAAGWRHVGAFVDAAGKRISPAAFVLADNIDGRSQLVGTGNGFALFFPEDRHPRMLLLDLGGRVTASRPLPLELAANQRPVAWNGTHFASVDGRHVVFFDRDGAVVRKVELLCAPAFNDVFAAGTDVVVAGVCRGGRLRVHVLASDGSLATTMIDPSFGDRAVRATGVRRDDGALLLVWGTDDSLRSAVLSSEGSSATQILDDTVAAFDPLLLTKTADGYLLTVASYGALHMAALNEDGALRVVHEVPLEHFRPDSAAATDGANVLVVNASSFPPLVTHLYTPDAKLAASDVVSIEPARQVAPAIGAGGESLVAAWTEVQSGMTTVRAARLTPDGTVLGDDVLEPNGRLASRDLAWNGTHYLTVILRNGQLRAQRITALGERVGSPKRLFDVALHVVPRAAVVWTGDRWVVAGTDGITAFYAEVSAEGDRLSWSPLRLEGPLLDERSYRGGVHDVALAYDGERVHVAWIESQTVPCNFECIALQVAFAATIEDHGLTVGTPWLAGGPSSWQSISLAANGSDVVALANDYGEGVVTTARGVSRAFAGLGDVTWDGSAFALAVRERERLTIHRLDGRLRDRGPARVASVAPPDLEQSPPGIAPGMPGSAVVVLHECEASKGGRAVAFVEHELEIELEPARRRAVRR